MINAIIHLKTEAEHYRKLAQADVGADAPQSLPAKKNNELADEFELAAEALRKLHNEGFAEGVLAGIKALAESCNARREKHAQTPEPISEIAKPMAANPEFIPPDIQNKQSPVNSAGNLETDPERDRASFEWHQSANGTWMFAVTRKCDGSYLLADTQSAWLVWQEAAAIVRKRGVDSIRFWGQTCDVDAQVNARAMADALARGIAGSKLE